MNKTKKSALGAAGVGVVALAMLGGGTFAAWSDFQTVEDNTAAAGHLRLDLSGGPLSNLGGKAIAPGENYKYDWFLTSADLDGVPAAALSMRMTALEDLENDCATDSERVAEGGESCGDVGEFSKQAVMRVRWSNPIDNATGLTDAYCGTNGTWNNGDQILASAPKLQSYQWNEVDFGELTADQGICVRVDVALPSDATNATQGDVSVFDLQFDLEQVPGGKGY